MTRDELIKLIDENIEDEPEQWPGVAKILERTGFALVPIEPTEAMVSAGWDQGRGATAGIIWKAMIKAAAETKP